MVTTIVNEERLREKHSKWKEGTYNHILCSSNDLEAIRREVLYETICVKCGKEVGEHLFVNYQFVC